jgi:hypothetical protein
MVRGWNMAEFSFLYVISEDGERTRVEPFYENMERAGAYFKYRCGCVNPKYRYKVQLVRGDFVLGRHNRVLRGGVLEVLKEYTQGDA